jgi:hypothetical protein
MTQLKAYKEAFNFHLNVLARFEERAVNEEGVSCGIPCIRLRAICSRERHGEGHAAAAA